jgi:A/G-specific adenine glycosylase
MPSFFANQLLRWHISNPRPLPWDGGPRDPYHIWISEIIMQQTRIEQGAPYYLRFIKRFPSVEALAHSSIDDVLRHWQGLGYYSRARNLHKAAVYISQNLHGVFPQSYEDLLMLPGVGPYSAAAIASFSYGLPYPVVDGNVKRVVARFAGIKTPIDDAHTHDEIRAVANRLMKGALPGDFNQAIMNFGALVCKPKGPLCTTCPLSKKCFAYNNEMVDTLPLRSKKKTNKHRYFYFMVIHYRGKILLVRRDEKDIWRGLYTPPIMERTSSRSPSKKQIDSFIEQLLGHSHYAVLESSVAIQQQLSHQTISGRFHHIKVATAPHKLFEPFMWVNKETLQHVGKPKMVAEMMDELFL